MKEKNKIERLTPPDFKSYHIAKLIKTAWYGHGDWHIDQWNRIVNPMVNQHKYGQQIFDKGAK